MNKFLIAAFILTTSLSVVAAPKTSKKTSDVPAVETSAREAALKENQSLDEKAYKKTIQASEAQSADVSSFLTLQDPTPELRNRPWLWNFALKLQSFQPQGVGTVTDLPINLSDYGASIMPSLEFGFLIEAVERDALSWSAGLAVHGGYMSQKINLATPTGYVYEDTRLTTTLVSVILNNRLKPGFAPKMNFLLNPEYGFISYTQTSNQSSLANFSQQNSFWGVGVGAEYFFSRKWAVLAQYAYRDAAADRAEITNIQKNNLEIGTQVTW